MNKILILAMFTLVSFVACKQGNEVLKTPNGVEFEMLKKGTGDAIQVNDYVEFNILLEDMQGIVQFSSKEAGQPALVNIPEKTDTQGPNPILDIFKMCKEGDSLKFMVTPEILGQPQAKDSAMYYIGITKVMNEAEYQARVQEEKAKSDAKIAPIKNTVDEFYKAYIAGDLDSKILKTASGLRYLVVEEGAGALAVPGQKVDVNYYGVRSENGQLFDTSWKRNAPFSFTLGMGQVIKGWDEGVALLKRGSKAFLVVPADLAYGDVDRGMIKAGDELIFYVELLNN